ncbi:proto-oncogene Mas-like [Paroedura picta]|uniref:proto-oncogene Mas-like n=1 Tax=Paroedura picta TaxID=143630 RepID=UPI004056831D
MRRTKPHLDSTIMLHKSLLFLYLDADKNFHPELDLSTIKSSVLSDFSTVVISCLLISILGLLGNGIIFWLLCCAIKKTKFTVYAANLAACDFIALLRSFISFIEYLTPILINTRARQLMLIMFFFGHGMNSYFIAAMSTERCLIVFSPAWYQSHRQKCSTTLICAFLWTVSVSLTMLDHFLCTQKYILVLNISSFPCRVKTALNHIMTFLILFPSMVFSILALLIRMKIKPQQNFPARLDISIWVIVALHLIFYPITEIISWINYSISRNYSLELYHLSLIFYCMGSSVSPFVYFLVGCWKKEKGQEPFYMFLERALKYERKGMMAMQPDQEQA